MVAWCDCDGSVVGQRTGHRQGNRLGTTSTFHTDEHINKREQCKEALHLLHSLLNHIELSAMIRVEMDLVLHIVYLAPLVALSLPGASVLVSLLFSPSLHAYVQAFHSS